MLVGKGKVTIDSLAQVNHSDERVRARVRSCRAIEHIDKLDWLHRETCLLASLAHRCLDRAFVGLNPATGQAPTMIVGAQHE